MERLIKDLNVKEPNANATDGKTPSPEVAERINGVISVLVQQYAYSPQPNNRKGGLIGLAAIAIALMEVKGRLNELNWNFACASI